MSMDFIVLGVAKSWTQLSLSVTRPFLRHFESSRVGGHQVTLLALVGGSRDAAEHPTAYKKVTRDKGLTSPGLTNPRCPRAKAEIGTLHRALEQGFETGWPGTGPHRWV